MAGDGDGEGDFVELLFQELKSEGVECGTAQMLVEMAKAQDFDTVADALGYIMDMGSPDKAAELLRHLMAKVPPEQGAQPLAPAPAAPGRPPAPALNYTLAAKVLNRIVELGNVGEAQDLVKFLLVARDTDRGRGKMLDCYDVSFVLGSCVPAGGAESAGRVLFSLYSSEAGADSADDSAASQTLVPFILGTLLDHAQAGWATELAKQLMYTTLEEIEAGVGDYDYSVVGWCLAQMVWYGRADWAARLMLELERQQLTWYSASDLLGAVAGWGDPTYSMTIQNFLQEARRGAAGPPTGGPGHYQRA